MPDGRWGASTFVIGNNAYVVGGRQGNTDRTEMWAYDITSGSWSNKAPIPVARRLAAAFVLNGRGYVACGLTGSSERLADLWEYDPQSDSWSPRAGFPGTARYGTYHFALDGFGYVGAGNMGSSSGPFLSDAFRYDAATDSWSTAVALPDLARHGTSSFVLNGQAYVFGGKESDQSFSPDLWRFDPLPGIWTLLAAFPGEPRSSPLAFVYNADAVIGCGRNENTNFFDVWRYDPPTDQWSAVPDYPGESSLAGTSFSISGRAFGGLGWLLVDNSSRADLWELVKPTQTSVGGTTTTNNELKFYPIPAGRSTLLNVKSRSNELVQVEVFNSLGALVKTFRFRGSFALDINDLSPGSYIARWLIADRTGAQAIEVVDDPSHR